MEIKIVSKRVSSQRIQNEYPNSTVIDTTSNATDEFIQFSPFYPHGNIPIPFSPDIFSQSVEGIWQGLKVFETQGIDTSKFAITNMKNIKRTVRKYGRVLGHQKGVTGSELLNYYDARINIYLPSYHWLLNSKLVDLVNRIRDLSQSTTVILLDYETNADIKNISKPLSHASLIKNYINNDNQLKYDY